jgi:hypothetical protein
MKTLLASSALAFGIVATLAVISIALAADNKAVKAPPTDVAAYWSSIRRSTRWHYSEAARCDPLSALHRPEGLEERKACLR